MVNPKFIDHTLLKEDATKEDIIRLCVEALQNGFGAVCVRPNWVVLTKDRLKGSEVSLCTVIGFPSGLDPTNDKVKESIKAIREGANELDMVINIERLKKEDDASIKNEILSIKRIAGKKTLKIIIETGALNDSQKIKACQLALESRADFIKTSTGYLKDNNGTILGATIDDIKLIKGIVGNKLGIKASGGIKDAEFAEKLIRAGATRIGSSKSINIIQPNNNDNMHHDGLEFKYAWDWFSYHARQRFSAFNFFLVVFAAIVVAYSQSLQHNPIIGLLMSIIGIFASFAFLVIDIRNEELVNCGRHALDMLESTINSTIRADDHSRKYLAEALKGECGFIQREWISHRTMLRNVLKSSIAVFIILLLIALYKLCKYGIFLHYYNYYLALLFIH